MFYAVAVLFGAPLIACVNQAKQTVIHLLCCVKLTNFTLCSNLERTIAWSFLVSSLAAAPAAAVAGLDWRNWHQIFISDVSFAGHRGVVYIIGASTIAGSWLGAIPIPLDWDRPWQVR
jgi:phosphatidylinositol glycan class F